MCNDKLSNIYVDLVNLRQINSFGISCVEIKKLNNSTFISIDSNGRLLVTSIEGYEVIEENVNYFMLARLFEEDYEDVRMELALMNLKIEEIIDLDILTRIVLQSSPYWGELAYEWLEKCPSLNKCNYIKEMDMITKSSSHTKVFRQRVMNDLQGF